MLGGEAGVRKLAEALLNYLEAGCIIVSTVYPEALLPYLEAYVSFTCILRTHPLILMQRLTARGWPRLKILENTVAEATNYYSEVLWEHRDMVVEVDTTNSSASQAVDEIFDDLYKWRMGFRVDWLSDPTVAEALPKWLRELDTYEEGLAQ